MINRADTATLDHSAIEMAAAMGIALGMRRSKATGTKQFVTEFQKTCDLMAATRPTAVNLFWAIDRMKRSFAAGVEAGESVDEIKSRLTSEARRIHDEDVERGIPRTQEVQERTGEARVADIGVRSAMATEVFMKALTLVSGLSFAWIVTLRRRVRVGDQNSLADVIVHIKGVPAGAPRPAPAEEIDNTAPAGPAVAPDPPRSSPPGAAWRAAWPPDRSRSPDTGSMRATTESTRHATSGRTMDGPPGVS